MEFSLSKMDLLRAQAMLHRISRLRVIIQKFSISKIHTFSFVLLGRAMLEDLILRIIIGLAVDEAIGVRID